MGKEKKCESGVTGAVVQCSAAKFGSARHETVRLLHGPRCRCCCLSASLIHECIGAKARARNQVKVTQTAQEKKQRRKVTMPKSMAIASRRKINLCSTRQVM